ncbi:DNA-binding protein [Streptomyces sp. MBT53]|nr:DNA-binding protein [Streptomyces sp. MBT53]
METGHRSVQEEWNSLVLNSRTLRAWEPDVIPGLFQTPDYARCIFEGLAELMNTPRDTDDAVRARMQRQEWLYLPGKELHELISEGTLRARIASPEVMAAQLDQMLAVLDLDTVHLGVVPFDAALRLPIGNDFTIVDERLVVIEDWYTEHWLDDADAVALHRRVWDAHAASAVYGAEARRIIARVCRDLDV